MPPEREKSKQLHTLFPYGCALNIQKSGKSVQPERKPFSIQSKAFNLTQTTVVQGIEWDWHFYFI